MYSLQTAHVTKNASHSSTASSDFDAMSTTTSITKPEKMSGRDFANYFYAYGFLGEQKKMLECHRRMHAYYDSVFKNKDQFKDAVVLDVGTGSGILAIWAAQAGARKVYAVEATYMANHARAMVAANGVGDKVEVIQGLMENLELPEKVDIIISEWMGLFLLRESMLDSVLVARDKFMKPGGSMYPSHARMWVGAVANHTASRNGQMDYQNSLTNFSNFVANTKNQYGVDFSCLMGEYDKEQSSAYMQTSEWCDISPDQILGAPAMLKEFDLNTCTLKDIKVLNESFSLKIERPRGEPSASGEVHVAGFCGWFDVHFRVRTPLSPLPSPASPPSHPCTGSLTGTAHGFGGAGVQGDAGDDGRGADDRARPERRHALGAAVLLALPRRSGVTWGLAQRRDAHAAQQREPPLDERGVQVQQQPDGGRMVDPGPHGALPHQIACSPSHALQDV